MSNLAHGTMSGAADYASLATKPQVVGVAAAAAMPLERRSVMLRMFGSAVVGQGLLSAASLGVGLLLIRYSTDAQYGAYVLLINAILLLTSLQSAFFGPAMVLRMTPLDREGRGAVVGSLYTEQRKLLMPLALLGLGLPPLLWLAGVLEATVAALLTVGALTAVAALRREYFRIALLAHRRSGQVLRGDGLYVLLLVAGAGAAVLTPLPVMVAALTMGIAAFLAGTLLSRELRSSEAWHPRALPGLLRQIAPGAAWATGGAATHWLFSQGYSYVVALTLDVTAVAAIACTRLLLMPINLVSTGIGSLMLPVSAGWLQNSGAHVVLRRLIAFCGLMLTGAGIYLLAMWEARDWIFLHVMKKEFAQRDALLMLWSIVLLLTVVREQLLYLPLARGRFRALTLIALVSATTSIAITYWGMLAQGVTGALFGVIVGELLNVLGIAFLAWRELRPLPEPAPVAA